MKTIFIEAKYKGKIEIPQNIVNKLPNKLILFSSIQFLDSLEGIKKQLEESGKKVHILKSKNYYYNQSVSKAGQLIGCNIEKFDIDFDAFLYIGDGMFHPKTLLLENDKPVYVFNPLTNAMTILGKNERDTILKKIKGALAKFYSSKEIGVIISIKPGQQNIKKALGLKEKYPEKNFYFIVFNDIDFNQLENFHFVQIWVNTACPRIAYDDSIRTEKTIINIDDL